MSFLKRILRPLRRAAVAFFHHDVGLRRAKGGVQIVLKERSSCPAHGGPPSRAELAARRRMQEFALMRQQLTELLDDLPETRATMKHLVFVEQALERKGLRALEKVSLSVLQRALEQLDGLVVNWSPQGLAALRSKMAVAVIERERLAGDAEADACQTSVAIDTLPAADLSGLEVSSEDDALAAAYAALGHLAPAIAEIQPELSSPSARVVRRESAGPDPSRSLRGGGVEQREVRD